MLLDKALSKIVSKDKFLDKNQVCWVGMQFISADSVRNHLPLHKDKTPGREILSGPWFSPVVDQRSSMQS